MEGKNACSPSREASTMAELLYRLTNTTKGLAKRNLNYLQPVGSMVGNPAGNQKLLLLLQKQSLH